MSDRNRKRVRLIIPEICVFEKGFPAYLITKKKVIQSLYSGTVPNENNKKPVEAELLRGEELLLRGVPAPQQVHGPDGEVRLQERDFGGAGQIVAEERVHRDCAVHEQPRPDHELQHAG